MKCLVLSGGVERGISYLGVLKFLEEKDIIKSIECYIGTSIGSVFATLFSIGYTYLELEYIIKKINVSDIFLPGELDLNIFLQNYGFLKPEKLMRLIGLLISNKIGCENITFLKHFKLFKKKLIIPGACLNNYTCKYFSYLETPEMTIQDAIRISISLPIIYEPIVYDEKYYVDGSFYDNFSISFAKKYYNENDILGCLISVQYSQSDKIDSLQSYIRQIVRSISVRYDLITIKEFIHLTILIICSKMYYDCKNIETIDELIQIGYNNSLSYYNQYRHRFPRKIYLNSIHYNSKDISL